jgi:hypothetical protein
MKIESILPIGLNLFIYSVFVVATKEKEFFVILFD